MFVRNITEHQQVLLDLVESTHAKLLESSTAYTEALIRARESGLPYVAIGDVLGMSETAVRTYLKRRSRPLHEATVRDGQIVDTCPVCGDIFSQPDKGLGRAMYGAWQSRHQHVEER